MSNESEAYVLEGAMDRSVLVERSMSPQLVIIGGIVCTENWIRLDARQRLGNPAT
jgi:hypothetical protein